MTSPSSSSAASRFLDRLAQARLRLEAWTRDGRHPAVLAATLVAALAVAGGLAALAIDDTRVEVALPEPPIPTELMQPAPRVQPPTLPEASPALLAQIRSH